MRPSESGAQRGFTLLEVLVALVIVALGMSALLEMLSQSASNVSALRDKTVAEWIAMNQIALVRLSLNAPTSGTTQGDIQNCGNGNWHWQQQVSAVDAVPGLLSITVSVQRTGAATTALQQLPDVPTGGGGLGASGSLGANVTLGPTAQLGSVTSLSTSGCSSVTSAGSSLGGTLGGSLGNSAGPSLSAAPSLGNTLGPGSLGSAAQTSSINSSLANAMGGGAASSTTSGSAKSGSQPSWLVTLTGFRGDALGAASGETPDWNGTASSTTGTATTSPNATAQPGATNP